MDEFVQKRRYYRLKYPRRGRPVVRIDDQLFHVSEISEKGIRIVMNNFASLYRGLTLTGTLNLSIDYQIPVKGKVLRFDDNEVILQLDQGPSFKDMVEQQRHVRNKYPDFFARLRSQAVALSQ
ncbi:PilZ domain-containing protein [Vibrio panuliri]|uniref:Peptide chain release factor A n=1 Tax=Vibrio panuliri TaxID=1381081 RepID=A0A1Q9HIS6_9VIBR|nr:PilZ domain-containing protein [Vibrio panuliri]OLQ84247.1 peptide chain release factor A [Vibrio panuliri]OLQ90209.1 peptide chain release factor A [Vibrio panuliri]